MNFLEKYLIEQTTNPTIDIDEYIKGKSYPEDSVIRYNVNSREIRSLLSDELFSSAQLGLNYYLTKKAVFSHVLHRALTKWEILLIKDCGILLKINLEVLERKEGKWWNFCIIRNGIEIGHMLFKRQSDKIMYPENNFLAVPDTNMLLDLANEKLPLRYHYNENLNPLFSMAKEWPISQLNFVTNPAI